MDRKTVKDGCGARNKGVGKAIRFLPSGDSNSLKFRCLGSLSKRFQSGGYVSLADVVVKKSRCCLELIIKYVRPQLLERERVP